MVSSSTATRGRSARRVALRRIQASPGAFLTARDLSGVSAGAAARALSRLAAEGLLQRVRKGVYYVPKQTALGPSRPGSTQLAAEIIEGRSRPTGLTAANLLGMSTQIPAKPELAVEAAGVPVGTESVRLRVRPPRKACVEIDSRDAALLEFLRDSGRYAELSTDEVILRAVKLLRPHGEGATITPRLRKLLQAALQEPPRVRAMLGALLEHAELPPGLWRPLRASLNGLSRFNFGKLRGLPNAREWQAK